MLTHFASRRPFVLRLCSDCDHGFLPLRKNTTRCPDCREAVGLGFALFRRKLLEDGIVRPANPAEIATAARVWRDHSDVRLRGARAA